MSMKNDNILMLNLIDFEPYLQRHRDLTTVVWDIEEDYSKLSELASTNGDLLFAMTLNEFGKYIVERYPAYEVIYDDGYYQCRRSKNVEDGDDGSNN